MPDRVQVQSVRIISFKRWRFNFDLFFFSKGLQIIGLEHVWLVFLYEQSLIR